MAFCLLCI